MEIARSKMRIPPPTLNELTLIPKIARTPSPATKATRRIRVAENEAILAMFCRAFISFPGVSAMNMEIAPKGLMTANSATKIFRYSV